MTLKDLPVNKLVWTSPEDDPVSNLITPALLSANRFDCMVGYFGLGALEGLAHGLASFISRTNSPIRLLIGPMLSESDLEAIYLSQKPKSEILALIEANLLRTLENEETLESALALHTKECFAYLLAVGRIEMKIVIQKDGIFHPKTWIWQDGDDVAILSGSANFTGRALFENTEQSNLLHNWGPINQKIACEDQLKIFDKYFFEGPPNSQIYDLPEAVKEHLLENYGKSPPNVPDSFTAVSETNNKDYSQTTMSEPKEFSIPSDLTWDEGPFKHQGEAVNAWEENGRRGILSMATGSGKTITALISAWRLWAETRRLIVVIAAPTRPLVNQWIEECKAFNLEPIDASKFTPQERIKNIEKVLVQSELSSEAVEVIIGTSHLLRDQTFHNLIQEYSELPFLLITDEVHNFGSETSLETLPEGIEFRLGLSATPVRQYDEEGTEQLIKYFGEVAYEFSLEEAIGVCLVPYDYFLHPVRLTTNEMSDYRELSEKISAMAWQSESDNFNDTALQILRNKRRLILETAQNKLKMLEKILLSSKRSETGVKHTLIYATDKDPLQLLEVNEIVQRLNIPMHQITDAETNSSKLVDSIIQNFRNGILKVLTAKRVLDEGFNIPEISVAIILASTTVERQWVQRRGRVLRISPHTNKSKATIHDFLVMPPQNEYLDSHSRRLMENEKKRCFEFFRLSANTSDSDAAANLIAQVSEYTST